MDNQFFEGTVVELLPGREEVYQRALAGSRGTIRASKLDDYGFEKVYIEWDKDHWRYNEEPDGWTFASHFKEAEGIDLHEDLTGVDDYEVPLIIPEEGQGDQIGEYLDSMMEAFDKASESDGFYLITMRREIDSDSGQEVIMIDVLRGAADAELDGILDADLFRFVEQEMRRRNQ